MVVIEDPVIISVVVGDLTATVVFVVPGITLVEDIGNDSHVT